MLAATASWGWGETMLCKGPIITFRRQSVPCVTGWDGPQGWTGSHVHVLCPCPLPAFTTRNPSHQHNYIPHPGSPPENHRARGGLSPTTPRLATDRGWRRLPKQPPKPRDFLSLRYFFTKGKKSSGHTTDCGTGDTEQALEGAVPMCPHRTRTCSTTQPL